MFTVTVPFPVAKSEVDVAAFTVKLVPDGLAGVDVEVLMVSNAIRESSPLANLIVLRVESKHVFWPPEVQATREPRENAAVAPVGKLGVMLRAASKAPLDPPPLPLLTVIV